MDQKMPTSSSFTAINQLTTGMADRATFYVLGVAGEMSGRRYGVHVPWFQTPGRSWDVSARSWT
jgi:hypothetical protein